MAEANYDESLIKMKENFLTNLLSESSNSKFNCALLTKRKYDSIIENVKRLKVSKKKESREYRIVQRYDVLETVDGCEKLFEPFSDGKESVRQFVHVDELFDILYSNHMSLGHAGRDKMGKQLNLFYRNITKAQISTFLDLCEHCREKRLKRENVANTVNKHMVSENCSFESILGCSSTDIEDNLHQKQITEAENNTASGISENAYEASNSGNYYTETFCTPTRHAPTTQPNFTTPNVSQNTLYPNVPHHPRNTKMTQNPINMKNVPQNQNNMKILKNPSNMPQNLRNFNWKPNLSATNSPQNPSKTKKSQNPSNPNASQNSSNTNMPSNDLPKEKDQFDCFGEYIAMKLRQLDLHSASHVQKAVSDIIFDAEMGKYKSS